MKAVLVLIACAVGAWYWFVGGRQISEAEVRTFYQQEQEWLANNKPQELCDSMDVSYSQRVTQISVAGRVLDEADKAKNCEATKQLLAQVEEMRSKFGGAVEIESTNDLGEIVISRDKKTATVQVSSVFKMKMGRLSLMKASSKTEERFIKRNGKLLRLSTEGKSILEGT